MNKLFRNFIAIFLLLFGAKTVTFQEYIESFHSDIVVNKDASLDVTETIVYVNKGKRVRGIYRDFPTHYDMYMLFSHIVGFKVLKILKNGKLEPFFIRPVKSGKRLLVGSKDVYLSPGKYVYMIRYKTDKQLKFFPTFDELHWNVNGTQWRMPINKVSAQVYLPSGIAKDDIVLTAYTGKLRQMGKDYIAEFDSAGHPIFFTTRTFGPQENLTIVVDWPKGFVQEPTSFNNLWWFLKDNIGFLFLSLIFLLFLIFSIFHYLAFKRTQDIGTVIPLFYPPEGFTPGDVRYIDRCGYDAKVFAAEIVDMAVKGILTIKHKAGFLWSSTYTLLVNKEYENKLEEHAYKTLFYNLFSSGHNFIVLDQSNRMIIQSAVSDLKLRLKRKFNKKYFSSRTKYMFQCIPFLVLFFLGSIVSGIESLFIPIMFSFFL